MKMMQRISYKYHYKFVSFFILLFFSLICLASPVMGQGLGGITISPKKIVFEGRKRTAEVVLVNKSNKSSTYRIFFKNLRLNEDGKFEDIGKPKPDEKFSDSFIRYSPRQITVPANGTQSVRLMLRKPRNLPPGEYRSHLFFQNVPRKDIGKSIDSAVSGDKKLKIKFVAILTLSIPVLFREGELSSAVALSDLHLNPSKNPKDPANLSVLLKLKGNQSTSGDFKVFYKPQNAPGIKVAYVNGVALYSPNGRRKLNIPLKLPEGTSLKKGQIHVLFKEREKAGGAVMAKARLAIP